jgi:uncharacterized iron-regulated protein
MNSTTVEMPSGVFRFLLLGLLAGGCAAAGSREPVQPADAQASLAPGHQARLTPTPRRWVNQGNPADQGLGLVGVRASDQQLLEADAVLDDLSDADAICAAVNLDSPEHHWAELAVLSGLLSRARTSGREVGVGLQVFQTPAQEALDEYLGEQDITEQQLLSQTGWRDGPGHRYTLFRPLVAMARRKKLAVLALGAPAQLTRQVSRNGLDSLSAEQRKQLPKLKLDDPEHRKLFEQATRQARVNGKADRSYAAAVIEDETMADTAAAWLAERQPARQLLIVADPVHCRAPAVPARLRRRTPCRVVSVCPVLEDTGADIQGLLGQYDYALILGRAE